MSARLALIGFCSFLCGCQTAPSPIVSADLKSSIPEGIYIGATECASTIRVNGVIVSQDSYGYIDSETIDSRGIPDLDPPALSGEVASGDIDPTKVDASGDRVMVQWAGSIFLDGQAADMVATDTYVRQDGGLVVTTQGSIISANGTASVSCISNLDGP